LKVHKEQLFGAPDLLYDSLWKIGWLYESQEYA